MPFVACCPACRNALSIHKSQCGLIIACPYCHQAFTIPPIAPAPNSPPPEFVSDEPFRPSRYRPKRSNHFALVLAGSSLVVLVAVVGIFMLKSRDVKQDQVVAATSDTPVRPVIVDTKSVPKPSPRSVDLTAIVTSAKQQVEVIDQARRVERAALRLAMAKQLAYKLGRMSPVERAMSVEALKTVKKLGVNGVDPLTLDMAEKVAPGECEIIRLGSRQPPKTTSDLIVAICNDFSQVHARSTDEELDKIKSADDAKLTIQGVAVGLFEEAKPCTASHYRRLQEAGLTYIAYAQAIEVGMKAQGMSWAEKYLKGRQQAAGAKSPERERELLIMIWATAGILPEEDSRRLFDDLLVLAGKPDFDVQKVIQTAASLISS